MPNIENIKIQYPDKFGIKDKLRNNLEHNPEFLDLTLKSHELLSLLQNQKLAITESLRVNKNVSIFEHQIRAAQRVKNDLGGSALLSDEVGLGKTVEAGIINIASDQRSILWTTNNKKLMTIPFEENPYSAFAAFLKTDEGVEIYKSIEKKLK